MECSIRTWMLSDAVDLAEALNNPNVMNNLRDGLPCPYTQTDAESYIRAMLAAEPGSQYAFAIDVGGRTVGSIGVFRQANIHFRTAELGYYVAEPYWGRGVCTGAVRQICDYVFRNSDILRIFAEPFARNAASCRVLEKAGFTTEGILRKNAVKNGEILDMKLYSLIRE
ncbi:GNAT family N-acetyltransferase [Faecalispora anaeroviscerum]|uniref:GNAT family N-acetyltransferase n=1 Tax=Faecalispora anaeroviscerum TaxID=2991836 RepID=UPI0024BB6812|nr:GNAT family protein [Faecalispora anaeroviscerum]